MRSRFRLAYPILPVLLIGLVGVGPAASAQQVRFEGEIGVGGTSTWGDNDEAKFLEYRDLEDGFLGDFRFLFEGGDEQLFLRGSGLNLGGDDERYALEAGRYGHFSASAFLRELPHIFSVDARSLYEVEGGDRYRLPMGVQTRIAGAADPSAQLENELAAALEVDNEFRWLETGGEFDLHLNEITRIYGSYRLQDKSGSRSQAIDWGTPGGNFAVFPLTVDEKIHEVRAGGELLLGAHVLALEYTGSFFENEARSATVDNPLVAADSPAAASRGRLSLAPDNSAHSLALSGSARLPFDFPARASASLVYGVRLQDESFLPHTINETIASPGLTLLEEDLDGEVHTLLANLVVSVDPTPDLDLDLRYRVYRYDNRSDEILFPEHVGNDAPLETGARRSVANDYSVHKASIDAGYALSSRLTGHLGYSWEFWDRSSDRQVQNLHEHGPRAKLDYRLSSSTSLALGYAFLTRDGDGYDPFAYFDATLDADGRDEARRFGELPELRKFDQADRNRHRFDFLSRSRLAEWLEFSLAGGLDVTDYRNSSFGITEERAWNIGGEAYLRPMSRVGIGLFYDFEASRSELDSRWRPRSFFVPPPGEIVAIDDPSNDWSSRTRAYFHTLGWQCDVTLIPERLELWFGYDFHYGRERTTASGIEGLVPAAPPTTGGDGGFAENFPEIEEMLHTFRAGLDLRLSETTSILAEYRYERFDLDDDYFRQNLGPFLGSSNINGSGGITPSTDVFLADTVEDYGAHALRLVARIRF
jgi:MtrB/PioB family decaheme-associated outer membrane protein